MFWNYFRIYNLQRGETSYHKKIEALANMSVFKTPQEIQVFNGIA
jgi:hypothetical protein